MKSTGVVRKIDDLGRIVIPKEIRKTLGIRDGENLEIAVEGENIRLTKKNIINDYLEEIQKLCTIAETFITGTLMVTDREKVTVVTKDGAIKVGDKIYKELIELIDNRMMFRESIIQKIKIGIKELIGYFLIYPIIDDGISIGLIIVYNEREPVSQYEMLIIYLSALLSSKLDISW